MRLYVEHRGSVDASMAFRVQRGRKNSRHVQELKAKSALTRRRRVLGKESETGGRRTDD